MQKKHIQILRRPAVLYAFAFMAGAVFARESSFLLIPALAGSAGVIRTFLHLRKKKKTGVFLLDRLLLLFPVFLLAGFFVMRCSETKYSRLQENLSMITGSTGELLCTGTVTHLSRTSDKITFQLDRAKGESYRGNDTKERKLGKLLVYADPEVTVRCGQQVKIFGKAACFPPAENPGQFHAKDYYFSLSVTGSLNVTTLKVTGKAFCPVSQALFLIKQKLISEYTFFFGEEGAGILSSMLLGERGMLSDETKELYRQGGISHLLAISGLHVSLLGVSLFSLLRKTAIGRNKAIAIAAVTVFWFGSFTGAGTATVRAVLMLLLLLLAKRIGRTYDSLSAMAVSLLLLLFFRPGALYTASFQLSYSAAFGASVLAGEGEKKKGSGFLQGLMILLVSFPFTAYHFFLIPTYGLLLNPIVIPLVSVLLVCAGLTGILGLFSSSIGHFFAVFVKAILWLYEQLCQCTKLLPFHTILIGRPYVWQCILYFLLLLLFFFYQRKKEKKWKTREAFFLMLFLPVTLLPVSAAPFTASFLSVGQGDGIVLSERNKATVIVDLGSSEIGKLTEKRLLPFLFSNGIRKVDCAFVSHYDTDHVSGILSLLQEMPKLTKKTESAAFFSGKVLLNRLVLPKKDGEHEVKEKLLSLAKEKGVEVLYAEEGDVFDISGDFSVTCLSPKKGKLYEEENASSMVLLASYRELDFLLTGDITAEEEPFLLPQIKGKRVEIVKVAHHGSLTSSSEEFVSAVSAPVAVISCGQKNRFGHPKREIVERYRKNGAVVFVTSECGCVSVRYRHGKAVILPFLQEEPSPLP